MEGNLPVSSLAALLVLTALAGCGGGGDEPSPSPTGSPTGTGNATVSPSPGVGEPPAPGEAYRQSGAFTLQAAPTFPVANISMAWRTLTFAFNLNATQACYALSSEPPSGGATGPAPSIRIQPPAGDLITLSLPSGPGSCGTNPTPYSVAKGSEDADGQLGDWRITVTGRGQGVSLEIIVTGE